MDAVLLPLRSCPDVTGLALLDLSHRVVASTGQLAELWPEVPPRIAAQTVHTRSPFPPPTPTPRPPPPTPSTNMWRCCVATHVCE